MKHKFFILLILPILLFLFTGCLGDSKNQASSSTEMKPLRILYFGSNKNIIASLEDAGFQVVQNEDSNRLKGIQLVLIDGAEAVNIKTDILVMFASSGVDLFFLDLKSTKFLQETFFNNSSYETAETNDKTQTLHRITKEKDGMFNLLTIGWQPEGNYYSSIADQLHKYHNY